VKQAINFAFQRIKDYHLKQLPKDFSFCDQLGVDLKNSWLPINRIGVYVPGGIASYPSSVLMSVVPALVAGVKEIVITAPSSNSQINPAVIYASKICGIKKIYKIGGAQAITALALGTKSIKQVDKIVGPGNAYVAIAKKILFGEVGIDMIAGPTDVMIISNDQSNPNWIAIDALSQLEHGEDSKAFIVVDNLEFANKINDAINSQKTNLSRKNIIEKSLKNSAIMVIENLVNAIEIANFIAPEHLQLMVDNADFYVDNITNAGAIFIGEYTPEAIGDYVAGPSHTLPTSATARFASGLSVYDFLKRRSIINCNQKAFNNIAKSASIIAKCEGLTAHQLSIDIRNL
jgi:histidinol dehydrogenase